MDKEYIVKHNLMEAHKQFMRLSEGYLATSLSEAGEENDDQQEDNMQMPDNNMPMDEPNHGEQPQDEPDGEMPNDDIENMPQLQDGPMSDDLEPEEEDDVLDVEDLTQAQEKLNDKQNSLGHDLGEVDDRIIALLTAVEKIQGSLEKNNSDITALKAELEKRVPTDTEKLNMQSLKMYPFNVSPNDYWKNKEVEGRYQAEDKEENKKEYKITQDDVDNYTDREVENSFDDELHQTMKDIFKGF